MNKEKEEISVIEKTERTYKRLALAISILFFLGVCTLVMSIL